MKVFIKFFLILIIILFIFSMSNNLICKSLEHEPETEIRSKEIDTHLVVNILLVGMVIVFSSLLIIALIISLFRYLDTNEKLLTKSTKTFSNKFVSISNISKKFPIPIDHNLKAAIITIIFLYENEVENQSKMLLTMKRAKISPWQHTSILLMSNYVYHNSPKNRS